jgi:peroxiredoxin
MGILDPPAPCESRRTLPTGTLAPDFRLLITPGHFLSLRELRGRPVVLVFYVGDWNPVCADQLGLYQEILPELQRFNAELIGISVDSIWSHLAFADHRKLEFPLLADFEPKGAVARAYGVYREQDGASERALFVIDAEGIIRWSYLAPLHINPGVDGFLTALEALQSGGTPS